MSTEPEVQTTEEETDKSCAIKVIGWLSVGVAVAAIGIFVGRELCSRYRFNHRTPYDFYAHADGQQTGEFGMGI
jgi:hypothetical protein